VAPPRRCSRVLAGTKPTRGLTAESATTETETTGNETTGAATTSSVNPARRR
jgi:hypothetical protein